MKIQAKNEYYIKLDKIKTRIVKGYFKLPPNCENKKSYLGFSYKIYSNGDLGIEFSGKLFVEPFSLGEITKYNVNEITKKIYQLSGIDIYSNYLLYKAPVYRADVKEDIVVDEIPEDYISELRQLFKSCSNKFSITLYQDVIYAEGFSILETEQYIVNGIDITPNSQDNSKFSAYAKGYELKKFKNKKYRENFDYRFWDTLNHTIRFEYQIRNYKKMREVFRLSNDEPNIFSIVECPNNIIAELLEKLIDFKEV